MWVWKSVEFGTCCIVQIKLPSFFKALLNWTQISDLRGGIHSSLAGTRFFRPSPEDWEIHFKRTLLLLFSHHKRINVRAVLWRCGVTHVLLLIINYRSASHHLKNRAVPPWKDFYFYQFSIMFSLDPAQLQTGASPRTRGKKGSSWRETKQHIPPNTLRKYK